MFHTLGAALAALLDPALAVVAFTALVRLLLHPLTRAAVRGEKAKAALAPQLRELTEKHRKDPVKLQEKTLALYKDAGTSLFAGILPMLAQAPFFMVVYQLVTTPNPLLDGTLLGVRLGDHWSDGGAGVPVFLGLLAALAAVCLGSYLWQGRQAARSGAPQPTLVRVLRLLAFTPVLLGASLPLAAGLYLLTSGAWTLAERAWLHRSLPGGKPEPVAQVEPVAVEPEPGEPAAEEPASPAKQPARKPKAGAGKRGKAAARARAQAR
ncbi:MULTISPECIES: YidC/Oxa1 family membrane protein insertase [Actinosynnema]|uniref:YidC/Oxa1 family membrane protein insertase n=1 Tax=Actinosynnema TaxID=40566 RepID=UPI0020A44A79|nr:YidC/Oxa1 family membrane protein insertase [Actinosynnema pretiosum]MCP2092882.1 YidC/Oxa1 family membrane protein insertase [Actinosynnema pretiosum]